MLEVVMGLLAAVDVSALSDLLEAGWRVPAAGWRIAGDSQVSDLLEAGYRLFGRGYAVGWRVPG